MKKLWSLLFCVFVSSALAQEGLFSKALLALQKGQAKEASRLFSEFLEINPESESGRFNLALSLYRQKQAPDPARAYWRQVLFKNPYNSQTRAALNSIKDKKYFWLWIPADLFLALMAFSGVMVLFLLFKKKLGSVFQWTLFLWVIVHAFSAYYFYHRFENYGSLIQSCQVFSAPSSKAPVLFEQEAGALVKVQDKNSSLKSWSQIRISPSKIGWVPSAFILPIKARGF
ncbi:MAG: hypothetical protein OXH36_03425 [Bdellovibrionales bacterium]|nr:hypothetical protein [Bdellovibrionales bacterium]